MSYVPCNGCTACCKNQRIMLEPDELKHGYTIEYSKKGNDGPVQPMLAHKPNGDCWYLEDGGCSIHDRAPRACQEFDCRLWWGDLPEWQRLHMLSGVDRECAVAAKGLLQREKLGL